MPSARASPSSGERSSTTSPLALRTERALRDAVQSVGGVSSPPRLRRAIEHAVFAGGARLRPGLCIAVSQASGARFEARAAAAATAVELVHCASLVHDDLPCFDDADVRRGRPTVHKLFGEATAVLVGDALIVLAFEVLARAGAVGESVVLAQAAGAARGLIAGQAWEEEAAVSLDEYHRAKTGALFEAAAVMGAIAAGAEANDWRRLGETIGRAYQVVDDLADATATVTAAGKSVGRDEALARPSAVRSFGVEAAQAQARALVQAARAAVPPCRDPAFVDAWLDELWARLAPLL